MCEYEVRKDIRLKTWDYAARAYYHVTNCTADRACILGTVSSERDTLGERWMVELSDVGRMVEAAIVDALARYADVSIDNFTIMPNHVHMLVGFFGEDVVLGRFMGYLKSAATRLARQQHPELALWQRGYYEHIIRGEEDYGRVWEYIDANPAKWAEDRYYAA